MRPASARAGAPEAVRGRRDAAERAPGPAGAMRPAEEARSRAGTAPPPAWRARGRGGPAPWSRTGGWGPAEAPRAAAVCGCSGGWRSSSARRMRRSASSFVRRRLSACTVSARNWAISCDWRSKRSSTSRKIAASMSSVPPVSASSIPTPGRGRSGAEGPSAGGRRSVSSSSPLRTSSERGMRRRPFRTTERSEPRSTRRAIAFRLSPVRSAASVMVYVRKSSLESRVPVPGPGFCRTAPGSAKEEVPRGCHSGVSRRGRRGRSGYPAAGHGPERERYRPRTGFWAPRRPDSARPALGWGQSRGVAQPG